MRVILLVLSILFACHSISGVDSSTPSDQQEDIRLTSFILPALLIGYGVVGVESDDLKLYNAGIREEVNEHIDEKFTIDDVSQYLPFTTVYLLNATGVRGKHGLKERTCILGTAYLMMGATVLTLKHFIDIERPDKTTWNSFPSGHTATAFMGAEFMRHEYRDVSVWYGVAAYVVAAGTGLFRMYNDRHWLTDVAAGAGFGILSTRVAYILHDRWSVLAPCRVAPVLRENELGVHFNVDF